jgi:hypothetical protein
MVTRMPRKSKRKEKGKERQDWTMTLTIVTKREKSLQ